MLFIKNHIWHTRDAKSARGIETHEVPKRGAFEEPPPRLKVSASCLGGPQTHFLKPRSRSQLISLSA